MCQAFSCIVHRDGEVYWKAGLDSHDDIKDHFKLKDDIAHRDLRDFARVEITPKNGYLYPNSGWVFQIDESQKPSWWRVAHERKSRKALAAWKKQVYALIDLDGARHQYHPLTGEAKQPTNEDIKLLKQWASVWDSVRASVGASVWDSVRASVGDSVWDSVRASVGASVWDSVWASVGASVWDSVRDSVWDSVWDSVRDSVWAYYGSNFALPKWEGSYPYQPAVDLWKRGFVASYDGKVWRLHSGVKAEIVYTMKE